MTSILTPVRLRAGLMRAAATAAVSLVVLLPVLGTAGTARADDVTAAASTTEIVEPTEAVEPTDAVEPTELAEPAEPAAPAEVVDPVAPAEPIELAEAPEAAETPDDVSPIAAAAPAEAAEPVQPVEPVEPQDAPAPNALDPVSITAANDFRTVKISGTYDILLESLYYNDSDPSAVLLDIDDPAGKISVVGEWVSYDMTGACICSYQFTYRTISGSAVSNWATVYIEVISTGATLPLAYADYYTTPAGVDLNVTEPGVLSNDVGGANLGVWTSSDQTGEVFLFGNGNLLYSPPAGFTGTKKVFYQLKDDAGFSSWGTITIQVTPVAAPTTPIAANDVYTTPMNTKLDVASPGVLSNDSGGQVHSMSGFYPGTAALDPTGAFSYQPPLGFTGTVVVNYTTMQNGLESNVATITVTVTGNGGTVLIPTDPRDPGTPTDDPGTPADEPGGTGSTVPAGTGSGTLAHAGATTAWLVGPAAGILLLGCLGLGFAAHRRRASN